MNSVLTTCATTWLSTRPTWYSAATPTPIVDEVDSILIDEARTPLIISGKGEEFKRDVQARRRLCQDAEKIVIVELDDKVSAEEQVDGDYVVDEKHKSCSLTESGVKKAESWFGVENLADADNMTLRHYIDQAIKAMASCTGTPTISSRTARSSSSMNSTGRLMYGRRYNDGLHQAIEAKEGVNVAAESKTLADDHLPELLPYVQKAGRP